MNIFILILCIIFIALFIFIYFGSKTGLYEFENKDGKKIIFLGTAHLGTDKYWKKINQILNNFDGNVYYEGIPFGCGLWEILHPFKKMADYTETIYQDNAINGYNWESNWILSDLTIDEIKEFYTSKQIADLYRQAELFNFKPVWLSRLLFSFAACYVYNFENDILVINRNMKPLHDSIYSDNDALIFYGQAHYRGIKKELKLAGYDLKKKSLFYIFKK